MKRLIFIVEGDSEDEFVKRILKPYFVSKGVPEYLVKSYIITMSGGGHGFNNIEHFKNTIEPVLHYKDEPVITTLIDHYRLNSEKKLTGYNQCIKESDIEKRLAKMEEKLNDAVQSIKAYRFFIPYIQRHEFETLLFADPEQGFDLESEERIKQDIIDLCNSFASIEDINCTPEGAPSVRLKEIYSKYKKKYEKGAEAVDIAELTTIEKILDKCPRFKNWIDTLITEVLKA
ncbi:DUF4276 family protein [Dysgonomonas sp. HDW5A]|uniref:DUF4276 family protein n=1 Tax=Dysgonomonas sp. HDW5A TaxID=2714926 RepID=UPI00140AC9D7|nr:DUF4276 family protein [Dysgonomonas sp. HDW5A]QIK59685.1 DUF4276 family protein [Dysgonomonas sp. HDW5A]